MISGRSQPVADAHPAASSPVGRRWRQPSSWIAVGLLVASLAMIVFTFASLVLPGSSALPYRPTIAVFLAASSIFVVLPSVGAILAILRPRNPIGWLFLVAGFGFTMGIFSQEYVGRAVYAGASLPGVVLVAWIGAWSGPLTFSLALTWIPLLFPDGHLPGPLWRPVAWAAAVLLAVGTIATAILPGSLQGFGVAPLANPLGVGGPIGDAATLLAGVAYPAAAVLGLLSLASLVVRFRRSRDVERQQLKWFLFAVSFMLLATLTAGVTRLDGAWVAVMLGLASLPVAAGIAILRYRLYDIDLLINRTLVYGLLTAILAGMYAGMVALLQRLFVAVTGEGSDAAIVLSTVVVVSVFSPLRARLQTLVERRFKEVRDARAPLAEFVTTIETRLWPLAPEIALHRLLDVAVSALGASFASVALGDATVARVGEGSFEPELVATAGDGPGRVTVAVGQRAEGAAFAERDHVALQSAVTAVADALAQQD
jgi:hypothetical protein